MWCEIQQLEQEENGTKQVEGFMDCSLTEENSFDGISDSLTSGQKGKAQVCLESPSEISGSLWKKSWNSLCINYREKECDTRGLAALELWLGTRTLFVCLMTQSITLITHPHTYKKWCDHNHLKRNKNLGHELALASTFWKNTISWVSVLPRLVTFDGTWERNIFSCF